MDVIRSAWDWGAKRALWNIPIDNVVVSVQQRGVESFYRQWVCEIDGQVAMSVRFHVRGECWVAIHEALEVIALVV